MPIQRILRLLLADLAACTIPALLLLLTAGTLLPSGAQTIYNVTDLGTLGGSSSVASGINASGQVVGTSYIAQDTAYHAFRYDRVNGMLDMGTLGGVNSEAKGINDYGRIVGWAENGQLRNAIGNPPQFHAFCTDYFRNILTTDDLGSFGDWSEANAINNSGQVVGESVILLPGGIGLLHAFRHTVGIPLDPKIDDIGTLGGIYHNYAFGINRLGQIAGAATRSDNAPLAAYRTLSNGTLNPATDDLGWYGNANAINDQGQVIGTAYFTHSSDGSVDYFNAFLHAGSGPLNPATDNLGALPGDSFSVGVGINNHGQVVGCSNNLGVGGGSFPPPTVVGADRAFLWDSARQMRNLNDLIDPLTGAGWNLECANAINDAGQIVGWGHHNGAAHAFLLTPITLSSFTVNVSSVKGGSPATGTVALNVPAPAGGAVITLSSSSPTIASVPVSVTIPAGATSATFSITTMPVSSDTAVTLTASYNGVSPTASLTVQAPSLYYISCDPFLIPGGSTATGTVIFDSPLPVAWTVTLSSSNPVVSMPPSVTVPAGATSATFPVTTTPVTTNTIVSINASYAGVNTRNNIWVLTPTPASLSLSPTHVLGGISATGTVTLTSRAPAAGLEITMSSDNTAASVPATVTVPGGATMATFRVSTLPVSTLTAANIKATRYGISQEATLNIQAPSVVGFTVAPNLITGGYNPTGTITLNGPAPTGGIVVSLRSSNRAAMPIDSSVIVPGGQNNVAFSIGTHQVTANANVILTATLNGSVTTSALVVPTAIAYFTVAPNPIIGGYNPTGTITLLVAAPPGGVTVHLQSSNRSAVPIDSSVTIPAGQAKVRFAIGTHPITSKQNVTLSATLNGTLITTLTVTP